MQSRRPSTAKPASNRVISQTNQKSAYDDLKSHKSYVSEASRASHVLSQNSIGKASITVKKADQDSVITVSQKKAETSDSDVEEEDEWTAI